MVLFLNRGLLAGQSRKYYFSTAACLRAKVEKYYFSTAAWAAANLAIGTR